MINLMLVAAAALSPTVSGTIDVAEAQWDRYPRLETADVAVPSGEMVRRLQLMMQNDQCEFEGQRAQRFNIDINYAIALDPAGNATRILVEDVGCRPLELMVGQLAADLVTGGFVHSRPTEPGLFARRINFNLATR